MAYPYQIRSWADYTEAYRKSTEHPEAFWNDIAQDFRWHQPWQKVVDWNFTEPRVEWFKGARLNISENCLDRWAETQPHQPAIIWEANDPKEAYRTLSYSELLRAVCRFAQVLKNNGAKKETVSVYICPWCPSWPLPCSPVHELALFTP